MIRFPFIKTVRGRLLILVIGIEIAMLGLLVLNSMRLLHTAMTRQVHETAKQLYPVLKAAITAPLAQRDYATVNAVLKESRLEGGIEYIIVLDRTGRVIASSGWNPRTPIPEPSTDLPFFHSINKHAHYDAVEPISLHQQPLGSLHIGLNLSSIIAARRQLLLQGLGIAGIALLLSNALMLLAGFWLTRHLTALTRASLQVAAGNLSPPPVPEGQDQIGQLGMAFNTMSRAINERIHELTAAKVSAENSEERLRAITDSANDAILMMNPEGNICYWNPAAERIFGYRADEAFGKNLHKLLVPEPSRTRYELEFPEFLRSGTGPAVGKTFEQSAIRKDGSEIDVTVSLAGVMLSGAWHAVGIVRDITQKKQLYKSVKTLSSAVEHSPVAIIITDRGGQIEYVNPKFCQLTGYSAADVQGAHISILRSPHHPQEFYDQLWATIRSGQEWHGEYQNRRKDGSLFWTMASLSPIFDENGEITHFVGVREDIENQKRLQEELSTIAQLEKDARDKAEQANRAKSDFLASMSHEIRTPLNAIVGMSSLLMESELTIEVSPFQLQESIHQLTSILSVKASAKGLNLYSTIAREIPDQLVGDSFRLRQILLNLLGNAIKFTESGGSIDLAVEPVRRFDAGILLRFSVTDTGIGISPDKLKVIFDNFTQADTSTTRRFGGSGLGLSISRRLVGLMSGELEVRSTPGKGSCFSFTASFGIPHEHENPDDRYQAHTAEPEQTKPLSILIVDDNQANRTVLSAYFRRTDHRTELAVNGAEALEKIKRGGYDLMLLDMEMPVMDGYTAARLLRAWERETGRPSLPVIALTADALKEDRKRSLDAGCTIHMTKPVLKNRLLEVVKLFAADNRPGAEMAASAQEVWR